MKTLLTILLAAICVAGFSQKKPKINQAIAAAEEGNLVEAKSIIDLAIEHEKTKESAKTWFYRGQIYTALDTANNEPGAMEEAVRSFDKALELDPEQKSVNSLDLATGQVVNVDSKKIQYYTYYYQKAINSYNDEDFSQAATNFESAFFINQADTNSILNAAYAAVAAEDEERAKDNFNKAYEVGSRDKNIFLQLYNFSVRNEDYEGALDMIQKGREAFPDDVELMKYEINLYLQLERVDEAREGIEKAIVADPENADLLFSLGVLKEETGDLDGAMESYRKALEVDPDHFNSNFNIAVTVFNNANELMKERNALSYKEERKIKELTTKIDDKLNESLPLWEKLYSLNSSDETVLETLGYIYTSLKMNDKAEKVTNELDAIRGN